ncbi:AraC family transcriptional regulator [Hymenobacter sp. RP-2-7]|uniref:AraC family transcriptional regulator n=1 Tax=Hymenobacter polaris TaxID=2682546 RepID=A0A7Y0AD61_9BACT|nr:AraC family transcriptional regulator [Hymenobacter polaris]NML65186.1 AraC family transcriptional regulator [Hymenobacter polaris]
MPRKARVPLHPMQEKFADVYAVPLLADKSVSPPDEVAQPHRHDYYYCLLLKEGTMELEVDFRPVHLGRQMLFLLYPGQIHRVVTTGPARGWYLAFAPALLAAPLRDLLEQRLADPLLLPLTAPAAELLLTLLRQIHLLQGDEQQLFRLPIVQALVQAVGYQVVAAATASEQQVLGQHSARQLELTRAFRQLLRQPAAARPRPADYAAALHVSVRYLNDTVRAVTGFSLTHHLQQELVREAQRLLVQPGLPVSEVAYRLHFDDPKYFSRLFRRVVGTSPGAFRQRGGLAGSPASIVPQ